MFGSGSFFGGGGGNGGSRSVEFKKIPSDTFFRKHQIWLCLGDDWDDYFQWITRSLMIRSDWGVLDIADRESATEFFRGGVLKRRMEEAAGAGTGKGTMLILREPIVSGYWSMMVSDSAWNTLIENLDEYPMSIFIQTRLPLINSGILLKSCDYLFLRCSTGGFEKDLLGWIESFIGMYFQDIRIFTTIYDMFLGKHLDFIVHCSSEDAEALNTRVVWYSRDQERVPVPVPDKKQKEKVGKTATATTTATGVDLQKMKRQLQMIRDLVDDLEKKINELG